MTKAEAVRGSLGKVIGEGRIRNEGTTAGVDVFASKRPGASVRARTVSRGRTSGCSTWRRKQSRQLTRFKNSAATQSFDVTVDGKQIVFDRLRENSDIVLIDLAR